MTSAELLALPAAVPLWPTAARALNIGRTVAYELARAGEFPVPVLRLGSSYRVRTADLWAYLGIDRPAGDLTYRVRRTLEAAGGEGASPAVIAAAVDASAGSVQRVLTELAAAGQVVHASRGRWVTVSPANGVHVGVDADGREYVIRNGGNSAAAESAAS
jgi:hypothetical protein